MDSLVPRGGRAGSSPSAPSLLLCWELRRPRPTPGFTPPMPRPYLAPAGTRRTGASGGCPAPTRPQRCHAAVTRRLRGATRELRPLFFPKDTDIFRRARGAGSATGDTGPSGTARSARPLRHRGAAGVPGAAAMLPLAHGVLLSTMSRRRPAPGKSMMTTPQRTACPERRRRCR